MITKQEQLILDLNIIEVFNVHPKDYPTVFKKYYNILGKVSLSYDDWTVLHSMARFVENMPPSIRYDFIKQLVKHPDISKVKTDKGWTPLHQLAINRYTYVKKHKDFNSIKDYRGLTPKHYFENALTLKVRRVNDTKTNIN